MCFYQSYFLQKLFLIFVERLSGNIVVGGKEEAARAAAEAAAAQDAPSGETAPAEANEAAEAATEE